MEKQAQKEGCRIGQYMSSIHKLGGLSYFCCITEIPQGNETLMESVLYGINNDKNAKDFSKIILSYNDDTKMVIGMANVSEKKRHNDPNNFLENWVDCLLEKCAKEKNLKTIKKSLSCTKIIFEIIIEDHQECFPFKVCNEIVNENNAYLRRHNLLPLKEESDDDVDYAASAGIEW